jgi:hypothetical protein
MHLLFDRERPAIRQWRPLATILGELLNIRKPLLSMVVHRRTSCLTTPREHASTRVLRNARSQRRLIRRQNVSLADNRDFDTFAAFSVQRDAVLVLAQTAFPTRRRCSLCSSRLICHCRASWRK